MLKLFGGIKHSPGV